MKPYFQEAGVTLYCADFRDVLSIDLARDVDAVIADPPYGETTLAWDKWPPFWPADLAAVLPLRAPLWCFGSWRMFWNNAAHFAGWSHAQEIVWEKHNGSSSAADRFRRVHEFAVQWYRGPWADVYRSPVTTPDAVARTVRRKKRPEHWGQIGEARFVSDDGGPRLMRSVIAVRSEHGRAEHPTQKPVGIVDPLIRYSVPAGGLVLDPFAGSGTTLVAAKACGRRAIGIEVSEAYCEIAARRLAQSVLPLEVA